MAITDLEGNYTYAKQSGFRTTYGYGDASNDWDEHPTAAAS